MTVNPCNLLAFEGHKSGQMEFIDVFLHSFQRFLLGQTSPADAEADKGWGGNLNCHLIASCVKNICVKNYQNLIILLQVTINNVGDVFHIFLHILTHILLGLVSLGSAKADIGWGGKLNNDVITSCVRTVHTKKYENVIIFTQFRIENVRDVFWDTL